MTLLAFSGTPLRLLGTVFAWVILRLIGMNLIGLIVRGLLWSPPVLEAPTDRVREWLRVESRRMAIGNVATTFLAILLTGAYLLALLHFWSIWLAIAGGILMIVRIPDLIWDIRTGKPAIGANRPKGAVYTIAEICAWGMLPLIWHSLYK